MTSHKSKRTKRTPSEKASNSGYKDIQESLQHMHDSHRCTTPHQRHRANTRSTATSAAQGLHRDVGVPYRQLHRSQPLEVQHTRYPANSISFRKLPDPIPHSMHAPQDKQMHTTDRRTASRCPNTWRSCQRVQWHLHCFQAGRTQLSNTSRIQKIPPQRTSPTSCNRYTQNPSPLLQQTWSCRRVERFELWQCS